MNELEFKTVEMMENFGGSFVKSLASAFHKADPINFNKLKNAFSDYWGRYQDMAISADQDLKIKEKIKLPCLECGKMCVKCDDKGEPGYLPCEICDCHMTKPKKILDVCCGGRMFWFDKKQPDTLFLDNRTMPPKKMTNGATLTVAPDRIMDFRKLDLPDNSFFLVIFDPPHIKKRGGKNSWMKDKYGELDRRTWPEDLQKGFSECFRVLKENGVLIFKWSEFDIPLKEVLALTPAKPLIGHKSGKQQKTHWICFMKN